MRPILVAMKYVGLRPDVDPITGEVATDERFSGASPADQAALEWALRIAEHRGVDVIVATVGSANAEPMLRDALACGARRAVRVAGGPGLDVAGSDAVDQSLTSPVVGAALAAVAASVDAGIVMCGDWSLDRGSGSVPPFLAADLDVQMACGLVALTLPAGGDDEVLSVERRLDGGRRERLRIDLSGRAVLSVEGAVGRLRRATLAGVVAARTATVEVVVFPGAPNITSHGATAARLVRSAPFRPRARVLDGPPTSADPRKRVELLTGALSERTPPQRLELTPAEAADRILAQLEAWGELPV
jgi:electron transfer flavoprotein beta subunit